MISTELVERICHAIILSGATMGFVFMGLIIVTGVQNSMRRRRRREDERAYEDFLTRTNFTINDEPRIEAIKKAEEK